MRTDARGDRMGGGRIFLLLRQHQQVVVNRALVLVQKDVVGADDLPEFGLRRRDRWAANPDARL